jgi:hypothetical protein
MWLFIKTNKLNQSTKVNNNIVIEQRAQSGLDLLAK